MKPGSGRAVVIGASAGALEALSVLLPVLKPDYPLPILIVVHLPADRKSVLAALFREKCEIAVTEAEDKAPIRPGTAYFAPPDYHLLVEQDGSIALSSDEPVLFSRPCIDVLFETAAEAFGSGLTAVVLTGASADGANGLAAVVAAGGKAIVQEPALAFAPAMPEAAIAKSPAARVLPLAEIAACLQALGTP